MPRPITRYVCSSCGFQAPKWFGRCPQCSEWNTMAEEVERPVAPGRIQRIKPAAPIALSKVPAEDVTRFSSGMKEFDRVLGGGIVPGSVILLAGEPGIGKSTLLLGVAESVAKFHGKVLYTSGEESQGQVKMRAERLGVVSDNLYFSALQDVDAILETCQDLSPGLLIVDSIQTCEDASVASLPGGPTQVRTCATKMQQYAKDRGVTVVMVGHTVKAGGIAGPRLLEHLVDTVLYFEGDQNHLYRIVRAQKNRFGPTNEVSVFQMEEKGLTEVANPSELFLSERNAKNIGSCVGVCLKGNQAICLEVQALVANCVYGAPRRVTSEIEHGKADLILAVLSKRLASALDNKDAFLKVAGGIRIDEPGIDLSTAIAVMSSYLDVQVKPGMACFGEIGLSGEVRMVARMEDRVKEALRVGFEQVLVPAGFLARHKAGSKVKGVSTVEEAVRNALVQ
ncbi:MAG: DNA repair protein RadA [Bacillota bacterium]